MWALDCDGDKTNVYEDDGYTLVELIESKNKCHKSKKPPKEKKGIEEVIPLPEDAPIEEVTEEEMEELIEEEDAITIELEDLPEEIEEEIEEMLEEKEEEIREELVPEIIFVNGRYIVRFVSKNKIENHFTVGNLLTETTERVTRD